MASGDPQSTSPKPKGKKADKLTQVEQAERFKQAARDLGVDESGHDFEVVFERLVRDRTG